jgi:DNA-binding LytR/AlgR family response regulator
MNVLIANQKKEKVKTLTDYLRQYDQSVKVVATPASVEATVNYYRTHHDKIDLAFFETTLADGSSFDIFDSVRISNPVVFTSSDKEDAYKALKVNGIDYLLDPLNFSDISCAAEKALKKKSQSNDRRDAGEMLKPKSFKKRFIVKIGDKIQFKTVEEIAYFFADGKFVYLVTESKRRKYILEYTMEELEKKLLNPEVFYRINRKYIVNISSIEEVRNYANSRLKLTLNPETEQDMIVSRDKVQSFKNWLNL